MALHIFGIRHHGPGSARHLVRELERLKPDLIVLEGPHESEKLLTAVAHADMQPPVAMLAYQADQPSNVVFYPFAEFSPEWQAMRYALRENVELRMFDLPLHYVLGLSANKSSDLKATESSNSEEGEPSDSDSRDSINTSESDITQEANPNTPSNDEDEQGEDLAHCDSEDTQSEQPEYLNPLDSLAHAVGYPDGEAWWEATIEHRQDGENIFEAITTAMTALRKEFPETTQPRDLVREAYMRRCLRSWEREGFTRIAVVCGAWHVPALTAKTKVKDDNDLLRTLPKVKVEATWIPWTYDRLSSYSGYGAGINSPGWYDYLWHHPSDDGTLWVSLIAKLLRQEKMDISVAHVIETLRLAQTTASLRGLTRPTLNEYNEAVTSVMGFGDDTLLRLITKELVISDRLGSVPDDVPKVPLLVDMERTQKRLRLPFTSEYKSITLDLRKPNDLERSILLHRLNLLSIPWGKAEHVGGKGTFKESWTLEHHPEHIVLIIERAIWGNTIAEATLHYLKHRLSEVQSLTKLTDLLSQVLPADLPQLVEEMTYRLDSLAAATSDVRELLRATPTLVEIVRYGSVRDLDFSPLMGMLRSMIVRTVAGGIVLCQGIDYDTAVEIKGELQSTHLGIAVLQDEEVSALWSSYLHNLYLAQGVHPHIQGYATRLIYDAGTLQADETARQLSLYSSMGTSALDLAYWLEGFLTGSGAVLLVDDTLWALVQSWVELLDAESFVELLPVLRRAFGNFSPSERRKIGEKAKHKASSPQAREVPSNQTLDEETARPVITLIQHLLGLNAKP